MLRPTSVIIAVTKYALEPKGEPQQQWTLS